MARTKQLPAGTPTAAEKRATALHERIQSLEAWVKSHLDKQLDQDEVEKLTSLDGCVYGAAAQCGLAIAEPIPSGRKFYNSPLDPVVTHFGYTKIPRRDYAGGMILVGFDEWSRRMAMLIATCEAIRPASAKPVKRRRRGRQPNPSDDIAMAEEYSAGLEAGDWFTVTAFTRARHKGKDASTIRKAIKRGEDALAGIKSKVPR